jgi:hypothetical protein
MLKILKIYTSTMEKIRFTKPPLDLDEKIVLLKER